jgi:hypothetical protein
MAVLEGVVVLLAATVVFDVVHVTLHRLQEARAPWLRAVGAWHGVHHRFLGPNLRVDEGLIRANLRWHVLPEYATHVVVTTALLLVVPPGAIAVALTIETVVVVLILRDRGLDVNHRPRGRVPAYRPSVVCVPAYHALHHVRPAAFYSSWIKLLDMALGTTLALGGRSAVVVGAGDDLVAAMAGVLAAETGGEVPVAQADAASVEAAAETAELLVLVPPEGAGTDALSRWIEGAIVATSARLVPIEVWAVLPAATAFVADGRGYVDDERVIYRHVIVPRPGPVDPEAVARRIVRRARRGAHRIHTGSCGARLRDWVVAWRRVRPCRRGPRVAAMA